MELKPIVEMLDRIISDRTIPRNIRRAAEQSKEALNGSEEPDLRISTAIHYLDEIINDPNMPIYARTQIWNIVTMLEQTLRELK
jgi:hypothetical protein